MADGNRAPPDQLVSYRWFNRLTTRWSDNDGYAHVNNAIYYSFFDTTITRMMLALTAFDMQRSDIIGLVVEGGCRYFAPLAFPDDINAGLRVRSLGRSSVRYEIGLFRADAEQASAQGHFIHVMVDRSDNRPVPIPGELRAVLETLMVPG